MEIKTTGHSHNVQATLNYLLGHNNQAHKNNNHITKRNYMISGYACRTNNYQAMLHDMSIEIKKRPISVQSHNIVLSFSHNELDFRKGSEQVSKGIRIAKRTMMKRFPYHRILFFAQCDNRHAISHIHCIVGNLNIFNLQATKSKNYGVQKLRHTAKKVVQDDPNININYLAQRSPNKQERPILSSLNKIFNDKDSRRITSISKLRKIAKKYHLKVKIPRHRHYYKNKQGKRRYKNVHDGITFRYVPPKKSHEPSSHGYVKASNLRRFNNKISWKNIQFIMKSNKEYQKKRKKLLRNKKRRKIYRIKKLHANIKPNSSSPTPDKDTNVSAKVPDTKAIEEYNMKKARKMNPVNIPEKLQGNINHNNNRRINNDRRTEKPNVKVEYQIERSERNIKKSSPVISKAHQIFRKVRSTVAQFKDKVLSYLTTKLNLRNVRIPPTIPPRTPHNPEDDGPDL